MTPIMEVRVLTDIYLRLFSTDAATDYGMDTVWCRYAALRFGSDRAWYVRVSYSGNSRVAA